MTTYVLDASVAVKWSIPWMREPLTEQAVGLLDRYIANEIEFLVPDVFWVEAGNVFSRGARQLRWSRQDAETATAALVGQGFQTVPSSLLLSEALRISLTQDRNIYDCFYVALANESRADLITADERLANALAARFPVKWLGAY